MLKENLSLFTSAQCIEHAYLEKNFIILTKNKEIHFSVPFVPSVFPCTMADLRGNKCYYYLLQFRHVGYLP